MNDFPGSLLDGYRLFRDRRYGPERARFRGAWFDIADGELWTMEPATRDFSREESPVAAANRLRGVKRRPPASTAPAEQEADGRRRQWPGRKGFASEAGKFIFCVWRFREMRTSTRIVAR